MEAGAVEAVGADGAERRAEKTSVPTSANIANVSTEPSKASLKRKVPISPSFAVGVLINFAAHAPCTTATSARAPPAKVAKMARSPSDRFRCDKAIVATSA